MLRRVCFAFVSALTLLAAPAAAQTFDEMVGLYRVRVEPDPGSICQPGETNFEVLGFDGETIHYVLDGTRAQGVYDNRDHSFRGVIPFPDDANQIQLSGSFLRMPDKVNLVVVVTFPPAKPCRAMLSGSRPAGPLAAPPPTAIGPAAPSPTAPPVFGVPPQPQAPGSTPTGAYDPGPPPPGFARPGQLFGVDIKLLGGGAIVLLLIGAAMSLVRKPPAPPPPPPAKPEA